MKEMYKVRLYDGTMKDVLEVLRFCGADLKTIRFTRFVIIHGVLMMDTYVTAEVKKCLDILQEAADEKIDDHNIVYFKEAV